MHARGKLLVLVVLILAILTIVYFFTAKKPFTNQLSSTPLISLPINPDSKNITWASVTYNFTAPIKNLTPTTSGMFVTLDTTNTNIPIFLLRDKAIIMAYDKTKNLYYKTSFAALKRGGTITIIADYNPPQKTWKVRQVYVK